MALSGFLSPVIDNALSPVVSVQGWLASRFNALYEFLTVPRDVATLRQRNAELENQVSNLQTQVIELQQQLREAQVLYALLDFARERPENEYVACSVIGQDPSPFLHYIIIDHGSADGIRHGMPVVTEQGLVGRVDAVTASASRVQLITDPSSVINIRLQKAQTEALLTGSLTGDVVVGQVITVRKQETDLFQSASVQPAVDFSNLRAVLVITNFRPVNIEPLIPLDTP